MYVWHPAAVFIRRAYLGKFFSAPDALARFQINHRIRGKMPVQREKFFSVARCLPQNHDRSVILRSGIIRNNVNHAIQRRPYRSSRLNKKVQAQVNRAPFFRGISACPK